MLTAVFETMDYCVRTAPMKSAEAFVRIPLVKPAQADDDGRLPPSDIFRERTYARQWVKDGIAYYKEIWRDA